MDMALVQRCRQLGADTTILPIVSVRHRRGDHEPPTWDRVDIAFGGTEVEVRLKPLGLLFTGTVMPPDFRRGEEEYAPLFTLLAEVCADYCESEGCLASDGEMERLLTHLRDDPDGDDPNPLFLFVRRGLQVWASLHDLSRAEFHGVVGHMAWMARALSQGPSSRRYMELLKRRVS